VTNKQKDTANTDAAKKEESFAKQFWDNLKTVILAVFIALLIRSFLFEPFRIPSGSMYPTLRVGDYLFVSKYTYGYSRYSFPGGFPLFKGRIWYSEPKRGDVVVFRFPKDVRTDFIKRIIGLPGDKIQVKKGRLYINGEQIARQKEDGYVIDEYVRMPEFYMQYEETLPEGLKHKIIEISDKERIVDNTEEFVVPADSFFVMGDNRDRSDDSRLSVGFVPKENLVGKARFLFFSHNDKGEIYLPLTWKRAIRWSRLFKGIH
jgi:signal peptidase I